MNMHRYNQKKRTQAYKKFVRTISKKQAIEKLNTLLKRPDSFGYHGDKDMFLTWAMLPIGVTTRDDRDKGGESNQVVILEDLQKINEDHAEIMRSGHWACGWVEQLIAKVLHHGKPTRVGMRVLFWIDQLENHYPLADEDDYYERERESELEDMEFYKTEFLDNLKEFLGVEDLTKIGSEKDAVDFVSDVYAEDCGYRGRENAFVDAESIRRAAKCIYNEKNPFLKAVEALQKVA
jgi:hypothetical protein